METAMQTSASSSSVIEEEVWQATTAAINRVLTARLQQLFNSMVAEATASIRLFLDDHLLIEEKKRKKKKEEVANKDETILAMIARLFGGDQSAPAPAQIPPPPPPSLLPLVAHLEAAIGDWRPSATVLEGQQQQQTQSAQEDKEEKEEEEEERAKKEQKQKELDFVALWKSPGKHTLRLEASNGFTFELQVQLMPPIVLGEHTRFVPLK
ncbi:hypothetical protein TYRP_013777 [Tyrophagus putrescentiae]|nr:hypothetical protein TYRP_013777 [Tyrophagus putrescentiae]